MGENSNWSSPARYWLGYCLASCFRLFGCLISWPRLGLEMDAKRDNTAGTRRGVGTRWARHLYTKLAPQK